jgi:hypothetical protein
MKHLKYLVIMMVALTVAVTSCSSDDNNDHPYHLEKAIVTNAEVADEFIFGNTYLIDVTIELPNSCYFYYDQYEYIYDGPSRLIYPIVHVDDDVACTLNIRETTFSIPVQALQKEPYIFKFYQGEDADGEEIFLTIEVPVI